MFLVGGNSGASSRYQKRIDGYVSDLAGYHMTHMRQLVSEDFAESDLGAHLLNMFAERGPRLKGDAIARVFAAGNSTATTDRLGEIKIPTLVINGEFDHSLSAGQQTASLIAGAKHEILPGTGHACCIEKPAAFNRLVIDFLRTNGCLPAFIGE
jgi:pimeloyl-ACP methyl ester carboxylesterase